MGEYIDRQAAIAGMQEYWRSLNLRRKRIPLAAEAVYMDLMGVVAGLPSAQRKGKWIAERYMDEVDSCFYTRYKCSECGRIVYDSSLSYCHCGAEMKGEEDETD